MKHVFRLDIGNNENYIYIEYIDVVIDVFMIDKHKRKCRVKHWEYRDTSKKKKDDDASEPTVRAYT